MLYQKQFFLVSMANWYRQVSVITRIIHTIISAHQQIKPIYFGLKNIAFGINRDTTA